jgi:hypothetical protein
MAHRIGRVLRAVDAYAERYCFARAMATLFANINRNSRSSVVVAAISGVSNICSVIVVDAFSAYLNRRVGERDARDRQHTDSNH